MITKSNIGQLDQMIDEISSMVSWVSKNTQSSKRLAMMKQLVTSRRRLKRIYNALKDNPTIAAYGESQQGKSYIISSLLSSPKHPLKITDDEGNKIDFIDNINMRTDKQESTGVVTRFTTSKFVIDTHYPVKLHLLSVADFITILADSFMNDITGYQPYSEKDLSGITERLVEKYSDRPEVQSWLTEDEVANVEEYIRKHDSVPGAVYVNSGFFDVLSTIVRRIPENEWATAFAPLWKEDATFTKFFSLYISAYSSMGYVEDVYISIKAVLNDFNDGSPTLMCVRALDGLGELIENGLHCGTQTEVLLPDKRTLLVNKSLLSAMTAEAVYNIEEEVLNDGMKFCFKGIRDSISTNAEQNKRMLMNELNIEETIEAGETVQKPFKKAFLKKVDLLDFPGARGRDMGYQPSEILKQIVELLLRCKVSYLFNKYSEDLKLSILMFCHSQGNTTPNLVAPILNSWVNTYIGDTPEKRQHRMANYGVPPLFLVSTMYNLDLMIKKGSVDDQIWQRRLGHILYKEVIGHKTNLWFDNWMPQQTFDNTFLLRDYFYSSNANEGNNLFTGWPNSEDGENQIEERAELKKIFLKDSGVRLFFKNPELAWNVASTIGNDGSYYILKRLAIVSEKAVDARNIQFNEDIRQISENVLSVIKDEFHDEKDAELLEKSTKSARRFHFMLLRACEKQPDFFGRMIQFLQVNSNFVASYFHKLIHSGTLTVTTDIQKYEMLIRAVEEAGYQFDPNPGDSAYKANFEILESVFGITGPEDPMMEGIDPEALFQGTYRRNCSPSSILANSFLDYWCQNLLKPESSVLFTKVGFDSLIFSDFISNFTNMMLKAELAQHIANEIKDYVDYTPIIAPQNEEMVADIATNLYNSFVMNMGYDFLPDDERQKADELSKKYKFPQIKSEVASEQLAFSDEETQRLLFSQLESLNDGEGGQLTQLPAYISMRQWVSYVFMSFTVAYNVTKYDEAANKALGSIIEKFKDIQKVTA